MTFSNDGKPFNFDSTGQVPPPGAEKAPVTATLWEDEGTLLFHVKVNGVSVTRREDNHMINGSKVLEVSKLSQERKNEILDAEKVRHIVLEAPGEHLVGTWIPYDRALDLANKEGITGILYPLFVYNIGVLLSPAPGPTPGMSISEARKVKL
ncbi:hypothetical protein MFIFM68171_02965 [Madurella fahalii]|uniref:HTH APSES-type domain-containing protein n=1 Tax=Madurella fahalii TaxID=1157608 RepID=A0ABQ0G4Q2_9PEZI